MFKHFSLSLAARSICCVELFVQRDYRLTMLGIEQAVRQQSGESISELANDGGTQAVTTAIIHNVQEENAASHTVYQPSGRHFAYHSRGTTSDTAGPNYLRSTCYAVTE